MCYQEIRHSTISSFVLQQVVVKLMCSFGDPDCIEQSRIYYKNWKSSDQPLPVNFKSVILGGVIKYGNEEEWFELLGRSLITKTYSERVSNFIALASTENMKLLKL